MQMHNRSFYVRTLSLKTLKYAILITPFYLIKRQSAIHKSKIGLRM
jgi:hypothetical protein